VGFSEAMGDLILAVTFSRASRLFICIETTHGSIPMQLLREEVFRIFVEKSLFGNIDALKGGR
jgi:hypothetical protein